MIIKANRGFQHLVKHTDSTDLPVCSNRKAKHHKTMAMLSSWSHTGKGAFYGLKLHITADLEARLLALRFSTGASDDREVFMKVNGYLANYIYALLAYLLDNFVNLSSLSIPKHI